VFDDVKLIVNNDFLRQTATLRELFLTDLWRAVGLDTGYYRPLAAVVFRGLHAAFGMQPLPFHVASLLLHAATTGLVFLLARDLLSTVDRDRIRSSDLPALAGALLFAAHPVHAEAVAWISGLMDVGATFCALLFLYLHVRGGKAGLGSCLALLAGLLFKESAIAAVPMAAAYDLIFRRPRRESLAAWVRRWLGIAVVIALYAALRGVALGFLGRPPGAPSSGAASGALGVLVLVGAYLQKLVVPWPLNAVTDVRVPASFLTIAAAGVVLSLAAFLGVGVLAARSRGVALFAVLLIAVPLLPALAVAPMDPALELAFAERYLYFPSVGLSLLVAFGFSLLREQGRPRQFFALSAALVTVIAVFAVLTVQRNRVWRDDLSLWSDTARKTPNLARVRSSLGLALYRHGHADRAAAEFAQARRLKPDLAKEYVKTGVAAAERGQLLMAMLDFQLALLVDPSDADAHFSLGVAYQTRGWTEMAMSSYAQVLALRPEHAGAHNNLAAMLAEAGRLSEAIPHLEAAVRADPRDADARLNLARAYELTGRIDEAEQERRQVISRDRAVAKPAK
jgi:Flp pilus assembly protein TadD